MNNEYTDFMKSYHDNHRYCPDCNSDKFKTTLFGYILNLDKKDEYKDLNKCICLNCGSTHILHDRISLREINIKKIIK